MHPAEPNFAHFDMILIGAIGEDFSNVESLQYDLATLQSATNNFSDENKLGEGGFGGVYKVTLRDKCKER